MSYGGCACHGATFCPDMVCVGMEDDVPVFARRDSPEGRAALERQSAQEAARMEQIARIIEPAAWERYDEMGTDNGRTRRDRLWSLDRAGKILAHIQGATGGRRPNSRGGFQ